MKEFPNILPLVYLDSAATSLKPLSVLEAQKEYNQKLISNINRGIGKHNLESSGVIEKIRSRIGNFIGTKSNKEILFTQNTTSGINLIINNFIANIFKPDSNIVITQLEHHSNFAPWIEFGKKNNLEIRIAPLRDDYTLDLNKLLELIDPNTLIVSITGMSNVTGEEINLEPVIRMVRKNKSLILIDGAQYICHRNIDVSTMDIDFFVFSAHKIFGPFGLGIVYGRESLLKQFTPVNIGGNTISYIDRNLNIFYKDIPYRLEGGTGFNDGIYAFNKTLDFLENYPLAYRNKIISELSCYFYDELIKLGNILIYSKKGADIISFNIIGVHPHDASDFFDKENIIVRVGNLCSSPFFFNLSERGVIRVSPSFFNTRNDINKLLKVIQEIKEFFL